MRRMTGESYQKIAEDIGRKVEARTTAKRLAVLYRSSARGSRTEARYKADPKHFAPQSLDVLDRIFDLQIETEDGESTFRLDSPRMHLTLGTDLVNRMVRYKMGIEATWIRETPPSEKDYREEFGPTNREQMAEIIAGCEPLPPPVNYSITNYPRS